ncbi:MAG: diguanylate cyclase [Deltaproteobacteria bacterium]|nr:diguanylate cyclase [Deltaproteobacteria bacterium]
MIKIAVDEVLRWLASLDVASQTHVEWLKHVHHMLLFHRAPDAKSMVDDSHCHCVFGRWYLSPTSRELGHLPGLIEMEVAHREMHASASVLLAATLETGAVPEPEYDAFMNRVIRLSALIRLVQSEAWALISTKDPLTGLFNRRAMDSFIAERRDAPAGSVVAICDIDHFKRVNDTYGHVAGDEVLRQVAGCLREQVRAQDMIFRYGGEEFLIVFSDVDLTLDAALCERLRGALAEREITIHGSHTIRVTASFGVATLSDSGDFLSAIVRADAALYRAKDEGRNRVAIAESPTAPSSTLPPSP